MQERSPVEIKIRATSSKGRPCCVGRPVTLLEFPLVRCFTGRKRSRGLLFTLNGVASERFRSRHRSVCRYVQIMVVIIIATDKVTANQVMNDRGFSVRVPLVCDELYICECGSDTLPGGAKR